jgi:putative FmdB family regulatory protein
MPLYDYRCTQCGHQVEVMHGIDDAGPSTCALCGGAMRKALSPPAIVFKGSGWAKKDARSGSSSTSPKPADTGGATRQDGGTKSGSSGEGGSSTSPDTSTSSKPAPTGGTGAD